RIPQPKRGPCRSQRISPKKTTIKQKEKENKQVLRRQPLWPCLVCEPESSTARWRDLEHEAAQRDNAKCDLEKRNKEKTKNKSKQKQIPVSTMSSTIITSAPEMSWRKSIT